MQELLATPVAASKAGNRITNSSGDSGLDPFATKGIIGTPSETQMVSEDDGVGKDNCLCSDFEGCPVASEENAFFAGNTDPELGGDSASRQQPPLRIL